MSLPLACAQRCLHRTLSRSICPQTQRRGVAAAAAAAVAAQVERGSSQNSRERNGMNRRDRVNETQRKRLRRDDAGKPLPVYVTRFSKEEIDNEERRPKRKVAVLFGYAGTGYKGLQLSDNEKTIEGEIFQALVAAGAISKANADDPKKTALVRCARTDKGVHAAGNVLSMKLIIEDEDIVQKINDNLSPQIRVWGIERTSGSFSAYQLCDSRIYEYLIPTHCFVPPHPDSFLGKKLVQLAEEENDLDGYNSRQADVATFWTEAQERYVRPVLEKLDPEIQTKALSVIFQGGSRLLKDQRIVHGDPSATKEAENNDPKSEEPQTEIPTEREEEPTTSEEQKLSKPRTMSDLELAVRAIKAAYQAAKLDYRISPARLARVRSTLSRYVGVHNFHNYTINKSPHDPSAKRMIKSFVTAPDPILIQNTEWLSLKVHGQSFMMHQIRKMVSLAAMVVRCGTHEGRVQDTFLPEKYVIPTAPGLGLLLERPVFDSYNRKQRGGGGGGRGGGSSTTAAQEDPTPTTTTTTTTTTDGETLTPTPTTTTTPAPAPAPAPDRAPIDFDKYADAIASFKQREIYERIWREGGERDQPYLNLFSSLDNLKSSQLLYLSSAGFEATTKKKGIGGDEEEEERVEDAVAEFEGKSDDEIGEGEG